MLIEIGFNLSLQVLDNLQVDELEYNLGSYPLTDRRWVLLSQPLSMVRLKNLTPCNPPLFIPGGVFVSLPIRAEDMVELGTYTIAQYPFDNRKLAQQGPDR
jgi:hypothetical protein